MTLAARLVDRTPPWLGVLAICTGSAVLMALGFAACLGYQEARRVSDSPDNPVGGASWQVMGAI